MDNIIKNIENRLSDKRLKIELTNKAKNYIVDNSFNQQFGARPLKRFVSKNIESLIANNLLEDKIEYNSTLLIDIDNNKFIIK